MIPHWEDKALFCATYQLPRLGLGPLKDLRADTLLQGPSTLTRVLLLELEGYKDTVRCAALGTEVPRHHKKHCMQAFNCLCM